MGGSVATKIAASEHRIRDWLVIGLVDQADQDDLVTLLDGLIDELDSKPPAPQLAISEPTKNA